MKGAHIEAGASGGFAGVGPDVAVAKDRGIFDPGRRHGDRGGRGGTDAEVVAVGLGDGEVPSDAEKAFGEIIEAPDGPIVRRIRMAHDEDLLTFGSKGKAFDRHGVGIEAEGGAGGAGAHDQGGTLGDLIGYR